jgi:hypothetical protein
MLIQYEEYGRDRTAAERLAIGLGWFSLTLGAAEILAPRQLARLIGAAPTERAAKALRACGTREIAAGVGVLALGLIAAWRLDESGDDFPDLAFKMSDEQAITVKASLEAVETAWVEWCASGFSKLKNTYAVRFEPAPGARGTEVHLSGGGSTGTLREELRRFKQRLETGEIPMSDGPGLSRPARPREAGTRERFAEVRR